MIRRVLILIYGIWVLPTVYGQNGFTYQTLDIKTPLGKTIDFSEPIPGYEPKLTLLQSAFPGPQNETQQRKILLDSMRKVVLSNRQNSVGMASFGKSASPQPQLLKNFFGNISQGTPNDNDVAVSNSGKFIMSATNTNYTMYNDTGKFLQSKQLSAIAAQLGPLNRTFDPRVMYDPVHDRFISVFLQGSTSADTRIIVGFTVAEDPTKTWKFYQLPGNIFGDSSWSDYPIISITKEELFITVNRVKDNTPWQTGFIESLIWQVSLADGYAGDSLTQRIYKDIKYNGKSIWSICPAKGGAEIYGPHMYFVSMRPSDLSNDTVFLHEITNTMASGNGELKLTVLKSDQAYGLPPNAIQPSGKRLQTNDARALCAMYEDNKIHFVGNTMDTSRFSPGVYYGVIDHMATTPQVFGRVIGYDTMDIGYPSIAFAGGKGDNNSSIITFSYVSQSRFPGTVALFVDRNGELSDPVLAKAGVTNISMLVDSVERWGDYTGIQKKYNETGVLWLNGSYGFNNNNATWIAKVNSTDPRLGLKPSEREVSQTTVYPNPMSHSGYVEFEMKETKWVDFNLVDIQGKLVARLLHDKARAGKNKFSIQTDELQPGIYFIQIVHDDKIIESKKLVVAH